GLSAADRPSNAIRVLEVDPSAGSVTTRNIPTTTARDPEPAQPPSGTVQLLQRGGNGEIRLVTFDRGHTLDLGPGKTGMADGVTSARLDADDEAGWQPGLVLGNKIGDVEVGRPFDGGRLDGGPVDEPVRALVRSPGSGLYDVVQTDSSAAGASRRTDP